MKIRSLLFGLLAAFAVAGCDSPQEQVQQERQDLSEAQSEANQQIGEAQQDAQQQLSEARDEAASDVQGAREDFEDARRDATQQSERDPASIEGVTPETCSSLDPNNLTPDQQGIYQTCLERGYIRDSQ